MPINPDYKIKAAAAVLNALGLTPEESQSVAKGVMTHGVELPAGEDVAGAVVGVREAQPGYPVDLTYCTIGGTRYEVDHIDDNGKTRSPDDVAAIMEQLMYDGGHAVDPEALSTPLALESQPLVKG